MHLIKGTFLLQFSERILDSSEALVQIPKTQRMIDHMIGIIYLLRNYDTELIVPFYILTSHEWESKAHHTVTKNWYDQVFLISVVLMHVYCHLIMVLFCITLIYWVFLSGILASVPTFSTQAMPYCLLNLVFYENIIKLAVLYFFLELLSVKVQV